MFGRNVKEIDSSKKILSKFFKMKRKSNLMRESNLFMGRKVNV